MTSIKICGITDAETAELCTELGVNFIGLNFTPGKWRVTPDAARGITNHLSQFIKRPVVAGIFTDNPSYEVNLLAEYCNLDWIQLLGDETVKYAKSLKRPVIRVTKVADDATPESIQTIVSSNFGVRSVCLFDNSDYGRGGSEVPFNWAVLQGMSIFIPVLIGGGLTPENVGELIEKYHPWGVNVNDGIEWRGRKSQSRIKAFVKAVQDSDSKLERV